MPAPTLSHVGALAYEAVAPLAASDPENGYALAHYVGAIARMFDQVADLSRDEGIRPGWAVLLDPNVAPDNALDYLAQFNGTKAPSALTPALKRDRIRSQDGQRRGSPGAIIHAAQETLTGTRTVYLTERHGSAYALTVATLTSETPDPAATAAAIGLQVPGAITWTHELVTGGTFATLRDTHADFADVRSTFATFNDVRADPARQ